MSIRFTFGGDEHIFAEVSEEMSLEAFFTSLSLTNAVRETRIKGVTEICPGRVATAVGHRQDTPMPRVP